MYIYITIPTTTRTPASKERSDTATTTTTNNTTVLTSVTVASFSTSMLDQVFPFSNLLIMYKYVNVEWNWLCQAVNVRCSNLKIV